MKTALLFLSFFLFASTTISDAAPDQVLDTAGKKLRAGTDYYILQARLSTWNETCPLDVVQERHEVDNGLQLTFSPVDSKNGVVRVSTDQNIKFSEAATICVQSTVWRLESYGWRFVISTGGVEGNPERETLSNWFKIDKYEDDYKLVFCPTVCNTCRPVCGDVGVEVEENGRRRLVLCELPFKIVFKRA